MDGDARKPTSEPQSRSLNLDRGDPTVALLPNQYHIIHNIAMLRPLVGPDGLPIVRDIVHAEPSVKSAQEDVKGSSFQNKIPISSCSESNDDAPDLAIPGKAPSAKETPLQYENEAHI